MSQPDLQNSAAPSEEPDRAASPTPANPTFNPRPLTPFPHRGRAAIVAMLVLSLLASAATRYWADARREIAIPHRGETASTNTSFSSMNSFALGLLLGGLRGPLVMFLWTESESQKANRNLEGIDTQIEWIRLLQPEFDTVHIFQIWNKAYNLSVQMASLANKYSVILDALQYARSVDREKPEDINIVTATAQLLYDKLGGSTEKVYYRKRVRQETLWRPADTRRRQADARPVAMDPLLDERFNLLPALIRPAPGRARPADLPAETAWNDGSDLQYLVKYQPFPDGVSPFALAFNYYKRVEILQNLGLQRHAQMSDQVIDSRPALSLKGWIEEEWEQGRRRELQAFGQAIPDERLDLENITAAYAPDRGVTDRHAADLALLAYHRAAALLDDALAEYTRHISIYPTNAQTYISHMEDVRAAGALASGDAAYLSAQLTSDTTARAALLAQAKEQYERSFHRFVFLILRYYTDPQYIEGALPPGFARFPSADRKGLEDLPPQQLVELFTNASRAIAVNGDSHAEDRKEYDTYLRRITLRMQHLQK